LLGEPIVKLPAGTTTISGQVAHSLNLSFDFNAHSSTADSGAADRDASEPSQRHRRSRGTYLAVRGHDDSRLKFLQFLDPQTRKVGVEAVAKTPNKSVKGRNAGRILHSRPCLRGNIDRRPLPPLRNPEQKLALGEVRVLEPALLRREVDSGRCST